MESYVISGKKYEIIKLLGHGKSGYSYLAQNNGELYVLKKIHHEPCDYYQFGNKIEAERRDYQKLKETGILIPQMLAIDESKELILKEYVDGPTIFELVLGEQVKENYWLQMKEMCKKLYPAGINIDYFPTNFIVQNEQLYYIDYECNDYMEEWDFEHWGSRYWAKTPEFLEYLEQHRQEVNSNE
jgi:TP53 regulating kinase and related kinases